MDERRLTIKDLKDFLQIAEKNLGVPETAIITGTCVTDPYDAFYKEWGCVPGTIVLQVEYPNKDDPAETTHGYIRISPPPVSELLC